jgi:hypothetical protein
LKSHGKKIKIKEIGSAVPKRNEVTAKKLADSNIISEVSYKTRLKSTTAIPTSTTAAATAYHTTTAQQHNQDATWTTVYMYDTTR